MQEKIQQLAEKLYSEGVEKGERKADELLKVARENAEKLLVTAREEASRITADSRKQAEEFKRNIDSEVKLATQQALSVVRQKISDLVVASAVDSTVSATLQDPAFVSEILRTIVSKWDIASSQAPSLDVLLPEALRAKMEKALAADASALLGKGVRIQYSSSLKSGLQVSRVGGGFKVSLTDEDFSEFFKQFLRPRTRSFLFGA